MWFCLEALCPVAIWEVEICLPQQLCPQLLLLDWAPPQTALDPPLEAEEHFNQAEETIDKPFVDIGLEASV